MTRDFACALARSLTLAVALACSALACGGSTRSEGAVPEGGQCAGPGRYEAGKGSQPLPCCAGLNEVPALSAVEEGDTVRVKRCTDTLPLRVYACVKGTCGDGVCEAGESAPCGCPADCPSAAWGPEAER